MKTLVRSGQRINAIALYRARTGVGLEQARAAVDALNAGHAPPPPSPPREPRHDEPARPALDLTAIATLARQGQMIQAIKLYRAGSDVSLRRAKAAVEALRDGRLPTDQPPRPTEPAPFSLQQVTALVEAGDFIPAVKLYRDGTGCSLKTAKEAVDALREGRALVLPPPTPGDGRTLDLSRVETLARDGHAFAAMKLFRELTGLSLQEAKDAVAALKEGRAPVLPPRQAVMAGLPAVADPLERVHAELREGRLIGAIKLYRELSGLGLKEAKEDVEALRDGRPRPHGG